MSEAHTNAIKTHYICQTYTAKGGGGLEIGKQFQYTTAAEATARAEREANSPDCVGADAYMVTEDPNSDEIGEPTFLVRLGTVPEAD
ncbi:hypothetical protein OS189_16735 [Sulfitobacter sp. F26169L]|uniref:hypothetical protein n=1 Tax=Sulfitobacter sp. F26169L TaxID=2996015 RepID=UPI002260EB0E|nr:hypothetical protein [Sulfitobacter sp. F26169L]MCX7567991.1 hypothetical protein [Sulfitobacter sp. F26169L]